MGLSDFINAPNPRKGLVGAGNRRAWKSQGFGSRSAFRHRKQTAKRARKQAGFDQLFGGATRKDY